mmetsp:Transcript_18616/g.70422  ORF Transcript_18616/g.70422 Transcript_18616/m.70422 type:complete len:221 (+) Transcript_18616:755-1417(+)
MQPRRGRCGWHRRTLRKEERNCPAVAPLAHLAGQQPCWRKKLALPRIGCRKQRERTGGVGAGHEREGRRASQSVSRYSPGPFVAGVDATRAGGEVRKPRGGLRGGHPASFQRILARCVEGEAGQLGWHRGVRGGCLAVAKRGTLRHPNSGGQGGHHELASYSQLGGAELRKRSGLRDALRGVHRDGDSGKSHVVQLEGHTPTDWVCHRGLGCVRRDLPRN